MTKKTTFPPPKPRKRRHARTMVAVFKGKYYLMSPEELELAAIYVAAKAHDAHYLPGGRQIEVFDLAVLSREYDKPLPSPK
jgi:hypothetical protein